MAFTGNRGMLAKNGGHITASLHAIVQHHQLILKQRPASSAAVFQNQNETEACHGESPSLLNAFVVRKYNGKTIRDVCIDTHDLLNEPGGFSINLSRHGTSTTESTELRIHLGLRQKFKSDDTNLTLRPGTITLTDDYGREIFRLIKSTPNMTTLVAVLEINEKEDPYEFKPFQNSQNTSPEFLSQFMQPFPKTLTMLQVETPGMSAVYLPEWIFLIEQQTVLKILICNFGVVMWNIYEKCVASNSKTLRRVILRRLQTYDITKARFNPMDWSIFTNCPQLRFLKVSCGLNTSKYGLSTPPPTTVFLHENLEKLPTESLQELHLSKIWVEPCQVQQFRQARPSLTLCLNCHDKEYYDDDLPKSNEGDKPTVNRIGLLSVSSVDLLAEIRKEGRSADDKQLICIVLALFQIVIVALIVLFIILYFGHWRNMRVLHVPRKHSANISNATSL